MSRLKDKYRNDVVPALTKEFGYKNVMAVPRIEKVVVNMGLGEATANVKLVDVGAEQAEDVEHAQLVERARRDVAVVVADQPQDHAGGLEAGEDVGQAGGLDAEP